MSSLLTASDIKSLTGSFSQHFDTFSDFRTLIVHKEPIKTVVLDTAAIYPGYRETSNEVNFTYTPVSGSFPVLLIPKTTMAQDLSNLNTNVANTKVTIKVKQDARDFIRNGKNELFEIDGFTYNEIIDGQVQNFLGLKYYYFLLTSAT